MIFGKLLKLESEPLVIGFQSGRFRTDARVLLAQSLRPFEHRSQVEHTADVVMGNRGDFTLVSQTCKQISQFLVEIAVDLMKGFECESDR
jgi:hypothetical protein